MGRDNNCTSPICSWYTLVQTESFFSFPLLPFWSPLPLFTTTSPWCVNRAIPIASALAFLCLLHWSARRLKRHSSYRAELFLCFETLSDCCEKSCFDAQPGETPIMAGILAGPVAEPQSATIEDATIPKRRGGGEIVGARLISFNTKCIYIGSPESQWERNLSRILKRIHSSSLSRVTRISPKYTSTNSASCLVQHLHSLPLTHRITASSNY
jgi:hypothetical protein